MALQDCLALGAIFAATDTVAVLQVIRPEEAGILYSLVFGEGVMNDATSVALLRAVQVCVFGSWWNRKLFTSCRSSYESLSVSGHDKRLKQATV